MKLKLLTLDSLIDVKDAVCNEIINDLLNITDKNPNMNKYKSRFKKEFKYRCYTIKYNIEVDADYLNDEELCPCVDYEGEIRIFKDDKEINAFRINEETSE